MEILGESVVTGCDLCFLKTSAPERGTVVKIEWHDGLWLILRFARDVLELEANRCWGDARTFGGQR